MRLITTISLLLAVQLVANNNTSTCKKCHPEISAEFEDSMHKKSSVHFDEVHKAIWDLHPAKKKNQYNCSKCHTPESKTTAGGHEGISCISCHTITDVKQHAKSNENIYESKPKTFYSAEVGSENKKVVYKEKSSFLGLIKTTEGSPYHDIDYTKEIYYNGQMCMGCHSHKQNGHDFTICSVSDEGAKDKKVNCISCHMPKVSGSSTTIKKTAKHAYHGFTGVMNNPKMLSKYVTIDYEKSAKDFSVAITNAAPHNLLTHPLRVVQLKTTLKRDGKSQELKTHTFVKLLGKDGKPATPWVADSILKDNMIKPNEKRVVKFDTELKSGDELDIVLGFYVVNPKAAKMLKLNLDKSLTSFKVLKSSYFKVK
jgi:hypothetical protein